MKRFNSKGWLNFCTLLGIATCSPGMAQIVPDATLPVNSRITPTGKAFTIEGGTTAGNNLFHSFQKFSLPTGSEAFFNNTTNITNIFSRVTGREASNINGLIRANGIANIFLINPSGIVFGPNAALNIGGSFVGSTASSIKFADGADYSAVNTSTPPLLTISVPMGLQFNGNEGNIVVRAGTIEASDSVQENADAGQTLDTAQTVNTSGTPPLAIAGTLSDINDVDLYKIFLPANQPFQATTTLRTIVDTQLFLFDGSGIGLYTNDDSSGTIQSTLPSSEPFTPTVEGTYYLGVTSLGNDPTSANGLIFDYNQQTPTGEGASLPLNGWQDTHLPIATDRGDYIVRISRPNSLSSGLQVKPGQTLALVGGQVSLLGGTLRSAGGRVELGGLVAPGSVGLNIDPSSGNLRNLTFPVGVSRADVKIANDSSSGASIDVAGGGGGDININARNVEILGVPTAQNFLNASILPLQGFPGATSGDITFNATDAITVKSSNISSANSGTGNAGKIDIAAGMLSLTNYTQISSLTEGQGNAGDINIRANRVSADNSIVSSNVAAGGEGNGGSITIATGTLEVKNGAGFSTITLGRGSAGTITIDVRELASFDGMGSTSPTGAGSGVAPGAVGNAGGVNLTAGTLEVKNGAQFNTNTYGQGSAGTITIDVRELASFDGMGSTLFTGADSQVTPGAVGNAGGVNVTAGTLEVKNGAVLSASTSGQGSAGTVSIIARDRISFDGTNARGLPSRAISAVGIAGVGNGGTIDITAPSLFLTNGAVISARTRGQGSGGNININVNNSNVTSDAQVSTTTSGSESAGNINITATNQLTLVGSNTGVFANTDSNSTGKGGDLSIVAGQLTIKDGATVSSNSAGTGNAGNIIKISANSLNLNNGSITTTSFSGEGGNIQNIQVQDLRLRNGSKISASAGIQNSGGGNGGNINLSPSTLVLLENSNITANAFQGEGGDITINTQGLFRSPNSSITASSQLGIQGTIEINNLGVDVKNTLTPINSNFASTEQVVAGSCLARRNVDQGKFTVTGTGGLPVTPYDDRLNGWYALPEDITVLSGSRKTERSPFSTSTATTLPRWKKGDPIVEAQGILRSTDGRTILASSTRTIGSTESLICNSN